MANNILEASGVTKLFGGLTAVNNVDFVIEEGSIHAMLLTHDFFKTFTSKPVADATRSTEVLVCLSCESRAEVDALVQRALAAGGTAPRPPQDHGFMYAHGFEDLDGHIWELVAMDPNAQPPA